MVKTKVCPTCGNNFSYEVTTGRDVVCCSKVCNLKHRRVNYKIRQQAYPMCKSDGCKKHATRVSYGLCESCYYQLRRTGSTKRSSFVPTYRYNHHGYTKLLDVGHPLSDSNGNVMEHRKVMYEAMGSGMQHCSWCNKEVSWDVAVVDHLNESKSDNRKENLVMSCNDCNRARGAMIPYISKMNDETFDMLVEVLRDYRKHKEKATAMNKY